MWKQKNNLMRAHPKIHILLGTEQWQPDLVNEK
jgi:hypothetical protein